VRYFVIAAALGLSLAAALAASCSSSDEAPPAPPDVVAYAEAMEPFIAATQVYSTASAASMYEFAKLSAPRAMEQAHQMFVVAGLTYMEAKEHVATVVATTRPVLATPPGCANLNYASFPLVLVQACTVEDGAFQTLLYVQEQWASALTAACGLVGIPAFFAQVAAQECAGRALKP
jgi:hypothetical protein